MLSNEQAEWEGRGYRGLNATMEEGASLSLLALPCLSSA